jgi:uncharacterized protein (TIGR02246 family)
MKNTAVYQQRVAEWSLLRRMRKSSMTQPKTSGTEEKDRAVIAQTVAALADAWNKHDVHAFSLTFTEDADFTNVAGVHARGRTNIESLHAGVFASVFKDSHQTAQLRRIRFLTPELATVDVDWQMSGATTPDGTPRGNRRGLINCIVSKQSDGSWLFDVFHNTELTGRPEPTSRT